MGPDNDNDRKAYIDAFEKHARSEVHAARVIDSLIETCQFYPRIPELIDACNYIGGDALPPPCGVCGGEPWVSVTSPEGIDYAGRCGCERGIFLKRRDRERRETGGYSPNSNLQRARAPK